MKLNFSIGILILTTFCLWSQIDKGDIYYEQITDANKPVIFYENNGIVCMKAINAQFNHGWVIVDGISGKAMMADSSLRWKGGVLRFEIEFSQTGKYALYVLAHKSRTHGGIWGANDFKVWINRDLSTGLPIYNIRNTANMEGLMHGNNVQSHPNPNKSENGIESEMNLGQNNDFCWINTPKDGPPEAWWVVNKPGRNHIEFVVGEEWGFVIDKVYLTLNNSYPPSGVGPRETINIFDNVISSGIDTNLILPPAWAFGVMYGAYLNQQEIKERIDEIIKHDYPIDAFWIDSYFWDCSGEKKGDGPNGYMNFIGDTIAYPDVKTMWNYLESKKIKSGIWIWNCILEKGQEKIFQDYKEKGYFSKVYLNTSSWHNNESNSMCGDINFNNIEVINYFQKSMKSLFDQGLDFVKLDRSSSIPFCRAMHGMTAKLGKETLGRGFILSHTGGVESSEFKKYPVKWSDDSKVVWSQPDYPDLSNYTFGGLKENIEFLSDPTRWQYEIPFLTSDAGGFRMISDNLRKEDLDEELYIRWIQFSSFSPVMEIFASLHNPTSNMAYNFSPHADSIYRIYTHLRMQLFPYIYSNAHRVRWDGIKLTRTDRKIPYQYFFGDAFLVAPVYEKNNNIRKINLPQGKWINYHTLEVYKGENEISYNAPVEVLPLLVKAGSIIPKRPYASSIELGSNNTLFVDIYANDTGSFMMYEDDGISNDYLIGKYSKTLFKSSKIKNIFTLDIDSIKGEHLGMITEREYILKFFLFEPITNKLSIIINNQKLNISNTKNTNGYKIINKENGIIEINWKANTKVKQNLQILIK